MKLDENADGIVKGCMCTMCSKDEAPEPKRILPTDSKERKQYPITRGLLDYFPDACAYVAYVSFVGNEKHNPGEELHHARGKSMDVEDCITRHTIERGGFEEVILPDGRVFRIRHTGSRAWRALQALQQELEEEGLCSLPRGAKVTNG